MLELKAIGKRLGTLDLANVSLAVGRGEYFVLLGPSGIGKTVLLELIAGLRQPDSGTITWDGTDLAGVPAEARGFSMVYQDYALFPHMTVARNITYGLSARGASAEVKDRRLAEMVEMMGIGHLAGRRPDGLSGGEQQRVALARALATGPGLLLLDEPLAALDPGARLRLRKQLRLINRRLSTSVVHVTHDPEEAMALADRVGVMLGNTIQQIATPEDLFRRPSDPEVARFLGMWNVLTVDAVAGGVCSVGGERIDASAAAESTSHLWIKPEEIILSTRPFDSSARNQFKSTVLDWDHRDSLYAVRLKSGHLELTALITHTSFTELAVRPNAQLYATFKSTAVHCF